MVSMVSSTYNLFPEKNHKSDQHKIYTYLRLWKSVIRALGALDKLSASFRAYSTPRLRCLGLAAKSNSPLYPVHPAIHSQAA